LPGALSRRSRRSFYAEGSALELWCKVCRGRGPKARIGRRLGAQLHDYAAGQPGGTAEIDISRLRDHGYLSSLLAGSQPL
jgi:hypothetical protein